jgi:nucleotidyltransferase/DNA polymerase involved in DNA repair
MTAFLHIDMDAFFAAVEELDHPEWRGKPIIVGADPRGGQGRGVVSTASYAARAFGVRSAMPIRQAWQRCPGGIYVRPRMARYTAVSEKVMDIFRSFTPRIQPISLDEAFLDVTGSMRLFGDPVAMARRIKDRIQSDTGLTASVGVSAVKSVAKIASDLEKPDGLTVVPEGGEKAFLAPLEVRRLWGVGPKACAVLERLGIRRVGDLQERSKGELVRIFGRAAGEHYLNMANAVDPREVHDDEEARSISHETTFLADVQDPEVIARTLLWLADKVASRMRKQGVRGHVVTLKYRTEDFRTITRRATLKQPLEHTNDLFETAKRLWKRFEGMGGKVRLLGIGVSRLESGGANQMTLFDRENRNREGAAEKAVDRVRARFGNRALFRGSLLDERT